MNSLIFLLACVLSMSAFTQISPQLIGEYELVNAEMLVDGEADDSLNPEGTAIVSNRSGSYAVSLETDVVYSVVNLSPNAQSLVGTGDQECDDPGCCYITEIEVEVKMSSQFKKPIVEVGYDGSCHNEDDDTYYDISGMLQFLKR